MVECCDARGVTCKAWLYLSCKLDHSDEEQDDIALFNSFVVLGMKSFGDVST